MEYLFNSNFDDDFQMPLIFEWAIFEEQYQNLLYDYLKSFPNATEHNFKQEYKKKYKFLIKQKNNELTFKETFLIEIETPTELISKKVSTEDLLLILSKPIRNYLNSLYDKYYDINCTLNLIAKTKNFLKFNLINGVKINYLGKKCNIGYNVLRFLFEIITVSYDRYYIDENRYNLLKYDILKIYEFLSRKTAKVDSIDTKNKELKWRNLTQTDNKIPEFEDKINEEVQKIIINNFTVDQFSDLMYLVENFEGNNIRFTDLTKFNQIYYYFYNTKITQSDYKRLVKLKFNFDYNDRVIKGKNDNNQIKLDNLLKNRIKK